MPKTHDKRVTPPVASSDGAPATTAPMSLSEIPKNAILVWDLKVAQTLPRPLPPELSPYKHFALLIREPFTILKQGFKEVVKGILEVAEFLKCYHALVCLHHSDLLRKSPDERSSLAIASGLPNQVTHALASENEEERSLVFCYLAAIWGEQASHVEILLSADPQWPAGKALTLCRNVLAPDFLRHRPWVVVGEEWKQAAKRAGFLFVPRLD